MDDIIKFVKSLEKSDLLIDSATETVKHKIKKARQWISWCYHGTYGCFIDNTYGFFLIKPVASSLIITITGKGQEGGFLPLLALPLMMKALGKVVRKAGGGSNNTDHMDRNF